MRRSAQVVIIAMTRRSRRLDSVSLTASSPVGAAVREEKEAGVGMGAVRPQAVACVKKIILGPLSLIDATAFGLAPRQGRCEPRPVFFSTEEVWRTR